jgi:hypothetical protein
MVQPKLGIYDQDGGAMPSLDKVEQRLQREGNPRGPLGPYVMMALESMRPTVDSVFSVVQEQITRGHSFYNTALQRSVKAKKSFIDFRQQCASSETQALPGMAAVGSGALFGMLLALRKRGILRRVIYPIVFSAAPFVLFYPSYSKTIVQEAAERAHVLEWLAYGKLAEKAIHDLRETVSAEVSIEEIEDDVADLFGYDLTHSFNSLKNGSQDTNDEDSPYQRED